MKKIVRHLYPGEKLFLLRVLFIAFSLLSYGYAQVNNIEVSNRIYLYTMDNTIPSTYTTIETAPGFSSITSSTADFKDKKVNGYLQLGIDPDVMQCYDEYRRIEVLFNVTTTTLNSWNCGDSGSVDTTRSSTTYTLSIDFDPANQQVYTEKALVFLPKAYYVKAEVATVTMYDATNTIVFSGTGFSSLPQDLYFESGIRLERYYNFNYLNYPLSLDVQVNADDEIEFTWAAQPGAVYYEIEFAHVNDYEFSGGTPLTTGQIYTTFKNNATRIRVKEGITQYTIPNVFERGYVIARIRGIGMKGNGSDGCLMENEIPGYWSFENVPSTPFLLSSMTSTHYALVDKHEGVSGNNKNWKLSASYAEDGKHKEIVEYADGSSRVRQSVTRLSTTNEAVIGETAYDYQGRPTVQILPVPVPSPVVKYYDNFNREAYTSDKFSREHFDDDDVFAMGSCIPEAPVLSTSYGSSYYYSSVNAIQNAQQAFVPSANKYPYTQVVYTPDNTGRIKMQSGVGDAHILGSGHETKYFYGKPSQEELDRLFGTNVGYKSHYQKNMVIDANGQVSISFLDMSGKTIATALAGEPPANLNPLADENGNVLFEHAAETLQVNLLGNVTTDFPNGEDNLLSANGMVWSNTTPLLVETPGNYRFSYDIELQDYLDSCLESTCFDCVYDLEINVLNSCNEPETGFPFTIHLGGNVPDTICNYPDSFIAQDSAANAYIDLPLTVGNYTIIKILTLNEDVIGYYTQEYIENNNCLLTFDDFYELPDTSGCFYSCEDCIVALGDLPAFILAHPDIPEEELTIIYNDKKAACDKMCEDDGNDLCYAAYSSMLRDLSPGGQYAMYDQDVNNQATIPTDKLSIFHNDPFLPDYTNPSSTVSGSHNQIFPPQSDPWRHPHYFDKADNTNYGLTPAYTDAANKFYFDANGEKSKIYLDQDMYGAWVPKILLSATVMNDGDGPYVYPQDLFYMQDFISRYNDNWAKSLLVYHPEFLYMKECFNISKETVNLNIGGAGAEDYNTWEFDQALQDMNFTDNPDVMPSTNTNTFDLRESDPFFTNFGSIALLLGFDINDLYDDKADNYVEFPAIPAVLNMHQAAYVTSNCPVTDPSFTVAGPPACASLLGSPDNADYIISANEWNRLVGSYLALKQDMLLRFIHLKLLAEYFPDGHAFTNQCIGAINYDVNAKPNTMDPWMPCDLVEYYRYEQKQVRFGLPESIYNNGAFDPSPPTPEQLLAYGQQQVYQSTGLCPAAIDLQTLLYGLELQSDLTDAGLNLDAYNYLMLTLRAKIEAGNAGIVPLYTGSISGQVLTGTIGTNSFTLTLPLAPPANYAWSDVQSFANIDDVFLTGGNFTFTIQAQVFNNSTSAMDWVELTGWTDIQIGNCESEIPKLCNTTQEAKDFKNVVAELKANGHHDDLVYALTTDYIPLITPQLSAYLGTYGSISDLEWHYGFGMGAIYNTTNGAYIRMSITSGLPAYLSTSFKVFSVGGNVGTSTSTTTDDGFIMYGYTNMDNYYLGNSPDVNFTGSIDWNDGTNTFAFPVVDCKEPYPMDCQTVPHMNYFELKELIEGNDFEENECMEERINNFPANFQLISLEPDMNFSADLVSSTHFIAVILGDGEMEYDTVWGEYCKPIRKCLECDTVTEVPCSGIYFTVDISELVYDPDYSNGYSLAFTLPLELQDCYKDYLSLLIFDVSSEMPSGTYTLSDILDAWAGTINAGGGGIVTATHNPGSDIIVINLHDYDGSKCDCDPTLSGTLQIYIKDNTEFTNQYNENCCGDDTPPPCNGIYFTVDMTEFVEDPDLLPHYTFVYTLPLALQECYSEYTSLLIFDVNADMPSGLYTLPNILNAWASAINAGGGGIVTATHTPGSDIIVINLKDFDGSKCECDPKLSGTLQIYYRKTPVFTNQYNETCCDEVPCKGSYFTLDLSSFTEDPDLLAEYKLAFALPDKLEDCYEAYLSLFNFDVATDMPSGPYTLPNILDAWAAAINTGGGGVIIATHAPGSDILVINLDNVKECGCDPDVSADLRIYYQRAIVFSNTYYMNCCEERAELGGEGDLKKLAGPVFFDQEKANRDADESVWEPTTPITLAGPCDMNLTPFPPLPPTTNPCVEALLAAAYMNAENAYEDYIDSVSAAFRAAYIEKCMQVTENFRVEFINTQYHFTLYYYDQAGNLIKTVPPKAVTPISMANLTNVTTARNTNAAYIPQHDDAATPNNFEKLTTKYMYNTLNQPVVQKTPDAGHTSFIYDPLGRLVLSRNAEQSLTHSASYTIYDALGRIKEVGELSGGGLPTRDMALVPGTTDTYISTTTLSSHTEITKTFYDKSTIYPWQTELRNRVAYTTYRDTYAGSVKSSTYYGYDIHGNVKMMLQDNQDVPGGSFASAKTVEYEYDLVSGKVNRVIYQRNAPDQFIHRYSYDADNRITTVETSRNDVFYDRDASYFYYKHGPLARTELGELNVQGIDYTYTIHGWLKGINSTDLNPAHDMGVDGDLTDPTHPHRKFAKDAYAYALHYYDGDYENISNNNLVVADVSSIPYNSLYNGNIAMMQTSLYDMTTPATPVKAPLLSRYQYDQLNRLTSAYYDADFDYTSVAWNDNFDSRYQNGFVYDQNGNIMAQLRNGSVTNPDMDAMLYYYIPGTNKLDHVEDFAPANPYTDDIEMQSANNYEYDMIGNLVHDSIEEIDVIEWTVYGKVKRVTRTSGSTKPDLEFSYGPGGQRITKKVTDPVSGTVTKYFYFYDAGGNMMGTYKYSTDDNTLYMEEQMIYGSSRLGSVKLHEPYGAFSRPRIFQKRGQKYYELNNHLANVLTTISDRRVFDCVEETYSADIRTVNDYSAFGAPLAERSWSISDSYTFGFNGQEKIEEWQGVGNEYDYLNRIYDPRLGRMLSVDPLANEYCYWSPYHFAGNCPIFFMDKDGLQPATKSEFDDALKIIDAAEAMSGTMDSYFCGVDKQAFFNSLRYKINNPGSTYQGDNWFCGVAAASHVLLNYNPVGYAKTLISLFFTGKSNLLGQTIYVSSAMVGESFDGPMGHSGSPGGTSESGLDIVDFILLGSVRYTENDGYKGLDGFDPDKADDEQAGTWPNEMVDILEGYFGLAVDKAVYYREEDLSSIEDHLKTGDWAIGFVKSGGLNDTNDGPKRSERYGVHYVQIETMFGDDNISGTYWDYGQGGKKYGGTETKIQEQLKGYWLISNPNPAGKKVGN